MRKRVGVYPTSTGYRVAVRVGDRLLTKRFPLTAPLEVMQAWRTEQRKAHPPIPPVHPLSAVPCPTWNAPVHQCYVYFIRQGDMVKIGRARNVSARLGNLQTAHHTELMLVGCILADEAKEVEIHNQFREHRVRGEWFRLDADLIRFIATLPAFEDREPTRTPSPELVAAFAKMRRAVSHRAV